MYIHVDSMPQCAPLSGVAARKNSENVTHTETHFNTLQDAVTHIILQHTACAPYRCCRLGKL